MEIISYYIIVCAMTFIALRVTEHQPYAAAIAISFVGLLALPFVL